jgi:hypothetical protein
MNLYLNYPHKNNKERVSVLNSKLYELSQSDGRKYGVDQSAGNGKTSETKPFFRLLCDSLSFGLAAHPGESGAVAMGAS